MLVINAESHALVAPDSPAYSELLKCGMNISEPCESVLRFSYIYNAIFSAIERNAVRSAFSTALLNTPSKYPAPNLST